MKREYFSIKSLFLVILVMFAVGCALQIQIIIISPEDGAHYEEGEAILGGFDEEAAEDYEAADQALYFFWISGR